MVVALVAVDCALLALWHVIDPLRLQLSIYGHAVRSRIQVCAVIKQNLFRQFLSCIIPVYLTTKVPPMTKTTTTTTLLMIKIAIIITL